MAETKDPSKAAIASIETAELYGLNVLVRDINTSSQNATRFVIIAKTPKESGNRFSLLFTVRHETGALMQVMQLMAKYGMNLESINPDHCMISPGHIIFTVRSSEIFTVRKPLIC